MCQHKSAEEVINSKLMWLDGEKLKNIVRLESGDQAQAHDASFHLLIRYLSIHICEERLSVIPQLSISQLTVGQLG